MFSFALKVIVSIIKSTFYYGGQFSGLSNDVWYSFYFQRGDTHRFILHIDRLKLAYILYVIRTFLVTQRRIVIYRWPLLKCGSSRISALHQSVGTNRSSFKLVMDVYSSITITLYWSGNTLSLQEGKWSSWKLAIVRYDFATLFLSAISLT